jgi:hypothetical protein
VKGIRSLQETCPVPAPCGLRVPITLAQVGVDRVALRAAAHRLIRLRWSNHKLTRLMRREARQAGVLARLSPSRLCRDCRAWAASSFQVLPAQTERIDRVLPVEVSAEGQGCEEVIARLMRPYESPSEWNTARRIAMIDARHAKTRESAVLTALETIFFTTGLSAAASSSSG